MNAFHTLADTLMQAADLGLPELRRLVWGWQGLVRPGGERLRPDSLARMLQGLPVPMCACTSIRIAAVISAIGTSAQRAAAPKASPVSALIIARSKNG